MDLTTVVDLAESGYREDEDRDITTFSLADSFKIDKFPHN